MSNAFDSLLLPIHHRWFGSVQTKDELNSLLVNEFIQPLDVVYCEETQTYYRLSMENIFELLSSGNQNRTQIAFFHKFNIGDILDVKEKQYVITDIIWELSKLDATYCIKENNVESAQIIKIPVSYLDSGYIKDGISMQAVLFDKDFI